MTTAERIRTIRRELIALHESYEPPDEYVSEQEALDRVLDAWDEFEYAAGTAGGGDNEVLS